MSVEETPLLENFYHYCADEWDAEEAEWELPNLDMLPRSPSPDTKPPKYKQRWFARNNEWMDYCCGSDGFKNREYKYKYRLDAFSSERPIKIIKTLDDARQFSRDFRSMLNPCHCSLDWYTLSQRFCAIYLPCFEDAYRIDESLWISLVVDSLIVFDRKFVRVTLVETNPDGWITTR